MVKYHHAHEACATTGVGQRTERRKMTRRVVVRKLMLHITLVLYLSDVTEGWGGCWVFVTGIYCRYLRVYYISIWRFNTLLIYLIQVLPPCS